MLHRSSGALVREGMLRPYRPGQGIRGIDDDELYDLTADPDEAHNLAQNRRDVMDALELQLNRWRDDRLGTRPDPVRAQASLGVPVREWMRRLEGHTAA